MAISINTTINWQSDSLDVISSKQRLEQFLESQAEHKAKYKDSCPKIDAYNTIIIKELTDFINSKIK